MSLLESPAAWPSRVLGMHACISSGNQGMGCKAVLWCNTGLQAGVAQQSYPSAEAAWQAAWSEGRKLVQKYQAELTQACAPFRSILTLCHLMSVLAGSDCWPALRLHMAGFADQ
jgi:hypothetical protein